MSGSDDGGLGYSLPSDDDHLQAESIESELSDRPDTKDKPERKKGCGQHAQLRTTSRRSISIRRLRRQ